MRQVTGNMTSVVKGMDKAMDSMNLERVRPSSAVLIRRPNLSFHPPRADIPSNGQI